ncbi:UNVERIFIED_CONTAM: N-acetylmuramoyl-L-alanine amidase [Acetivibrio alkalicellulosi]
MVIINLLKKIHSYYLNMPEKKKLSVLAVVFIILSLLSVGFNNSRKNYEQEASVIPDNIHSQGEDEKVRENNTQTDDQEPTEREVIIVIDPGHGGEDLGASYRNMHEKDLNLDISFRLGKLLDEAGIKVVYTREEDGDVSLDRRVNIANDLDAALFISVHNNALPTNLNHRGTETLYCSPANPVPGKMDGRRLAVIVQRQLVTALKTVDNGIIHRPNLVVLRKTKMPAVIAEIAYMSNASDRALLGQDQFKQKAAQALADAVLEALEEMNVIRDEEGKWIIQ